MKSKLTSNQDRLALVELMDMIFVPSSFIRFAHTKSIEGIFKLKNQNSNFEKIYPKVYPYLSASFLEYFRLYGYYKLGELIVKNLS